MNHPDVMFHFEHPKRGARAAALLAAGALLAACATEPEFDASRLASTKALEVQGQVRTSTAAATNAMPRGKRAGQSAATGAAAGAGVWFTDPMGIAIAIVAPVVVVATGAAGGVLGGTYGAVSGISASDEEIAAAVATLNKSFRPEDYQTGFSKELASALEARLGPASGACVAARGDRTHCRGARGEGRLSVTASLGVVPSRKDGSAGGTDIAARVTLKTAPPEFLDPQCQSWLFRARAGNLMKLAQDDGAPLQIRMRQVLYEMAHELPYVILPEDGPVAAPKERPATRGKNPDFEPGSWKAVSCG